MPIDNTRGRVQSERPDGSWGPATPIPYRGWKARLAVFLHRAGNRLEAWDERGLGK